MKKALAQNPNMLRTMIGLGLTLILVLSYAVYSATIDSAYYLYHTSNEEQLPTTTDHGLSEDNNTQTWTFTTNRSLTWVNVSFDELSQGDELTVSVSDGVWYHHEMLGSDDAQQFSCRQVNEGFEEYNVCHEAQEHRMIADENGPMVIRGIVSFNLPMSGMGSLFADSMEEAEQKSAALITESNGTRVWTISIHSEQEIHPNQLQPDVEITVHELVDVEVFSVDTITELVWSIAALVGCFGIALVVPATAYIASIAKEKRDERLREQAIEGNKSVQNVE